MPQTFKFRAMSAVRAGKRNVLTGAKLTLSNEAMEYDSPTIDAKHADSSELESLGHRGSLSSFAAACRCSAKSTVPHCVRGYAYTEPTS